MAVFVGSLELMREGGSSQLDVKEGQQTRIVF